MNSSPSDNAVLIKSAVLAEGAYAVGIARAREVSAEARSVYDRWIAEGRNGTMAFAGRYADIRLDPRLLLVGGGEREPRCESDATMSIICATFNYHNPSPDRGVAEYARGTDYHIVVRGRLEKAAAAITSALGGRTRVCVDSAPIRERYWARQAGLGFIGINNQLIVPGAGSRFVLGEIIWSGDATPDEPCRLGCGSCMACVKACPVGALRPDGSCDTSRCLSYLTIEHRGDLPPRTNLHGRLFGCDKCLDACPHDAASPITLLPEFAPSATLASYLDALREGATPPCSFRAATRDTALTRLPLHQLLRNLRHTPSCD